MLCVFLLHSSVGPVLHSCLSYALQKLFEEAFTGYKKMLKEAENFVLACVLRDTTMANPIAAW